MSQLVPYENPSEADRTRWRELRSIYTSNVKGVVEWCEAVIEAKETGIWMIGYETWGEFCEQELSMARASVRAMLTSGVRLGGGVNALPPKLTMDDDDGRRAIMENVAKSMASSLKRLSRLLREWPQDDLPKKKTIGEIALWMADNGVIMELRGFGDEK